VPFKNCTNQTKGANHSQIVPCSCMLIFHHNFIRTYNNKGAGSDGLDGEGTSHVGGNCLLYGNWYGVPSVFLCLPSPRSPAPSPQVGERVGRHGLRKLSAVPRQPNTLRP
jgi:hypothetical protein